MLNLAHKNGYYKLYEKGILENISNLSCEFGSIESDSIFSLKQDLNFKYLENIAIPKLKEKKPKKIVLTDVNDNLEEPTVKFINILRKNLIESQIILQSNNLIISENLAKNISGRVSSVEFNIDDIFENENIFNDTIEKFNLLRRYNINIYLSFILTKENLKYIKRTIDLVDEFDAKFTIKLDKKTHDYIDELELLIIYKDIIEYMIEKNYTSENIFDIENKKIPFFYFNLKRAISEYILLSEEGDCDIEYNLNILLSILNKYIVQNKGENNETSFTSI